MRVIRTKTVLWLSAVYVFSFICYLPMMLKQSGVVIPDVLLYLKYGFVFVPALVSVIFLMKEHNLKKCFKVQFKKFSLSEIIICSCTALTGALTAYFYSILKNDDIFNNTYSSLLSLIISCMYLFATALIEETAWRGFLFNRLSKRGGCLKISVFVGIAWAVWHIPMWSIRNMLSFQEIIPLFIWAVLISVVLGLVYRKFGNILSAAVLHMTFNVCFLAPMKYNNVIIFFVLLYFTL